MSPRFPANVSWSQLASWQRSFGSKAAIALPLLSLAVSTLPEDSLLRLISGNWKVHALFWGAVLFLVGQVVIFRNRPVEFARDTTVHQDIKDARLIATFEMFKNRTQLLRRLVERFEAAPPAGIQPSVLSIARARVNTAIGCDERNWKSHLGLLVVSQRSLREFDNPAIRIAAVYLLTVGTVLMALPTVVNAGIAAWRLLAVYLHSISAML